MELELNNKIIGGIVLIGLSMALLLIAVSFFSPEAMCLSALFGFLLGVIGLLLILGGGIESINEWRSGNKKPNLLIIGILAILFVAITILKLLIPELREDYFDVIFAIILISSLLFLFVQSKKSQ